MTEAIKDLPADAIERLTQPVEVGCYWLTKTEEGEEIDRLMAIIEDQAQQIDRLTIALQAPYDLQAIQNTDGVDMNRLF